ncbi:MAG: peptidoglycan editing factor PgeF [Desulfosalsimonadaceae bacterium]
MIARRCKNLLYFRFRRLAEYKGLEHAVFTRLGGHSGPPFASLNVSRTSGDTPEAVTENRRLIEHCLLCPEPVLYPAQVHGADVVSIKKNEPETAARQRTEGITADGVITDIPGLALGIQLADCQAVFLYDPVRAVVANVHSGWRGSIKNIPGSCVQRMHDDFSCDPGDIRAAVSPSLGPCCAEFTNYKEEIPLQYRSYGDRKNRFNFWAISRDQLSGAGLSPEHIECACICSKCNEHLFFSYRKASSTGRFAAVISLSAG